MITQAEIILRPFRSDDFERLISWASTRADLANWCAGFFKYPLDERQLVEYLEGAARPNARNIFTATTSAGEAVGHIEISHIWPHLSTRLSRVLVAPNRRRLGIGRAMIGRAVEFSFSTHCVDRIDLGVGSRNLAAIACYKRLMFAEVGTWKGCNTNRTADHRCDVDDAHPFGVGFTIPRAQRRDREMVKLGYKLMAEEHVPAALVRNTVRAEQAGFAFAAISDDSSGDRAVALAAAAHTLIRFERR